MLNEKITIKDLLRGNVQLLDADGNILVEGHNRITKYGRILVEELLLQNFASTGITISGEGNGDYDNLIGYKVSKVVFFNSDDISDAYAAADDHITVSIADLINTNGKIIPVPYTTEINDFYIEFIIDIPVRDLSSNKQTIINTLGFLMEKEGTEEKLLFSKFSFDPLPLLAGQTTTLKYRLSF